MYDMYPGQVMPSPATLMKQNAFAQARALWPYASGENPAPAPVDEVIAAARKIEEYFNDVSK